MTMRISHTYTILEEGDFSSSGAWAEAREDVLDAIRDIHWPRRFDQFIVYPEEDANGVNPIAEQFEKNLDAQPYWESTGRKHLKGLLERRDLLGIAQEKLGEYSDDPEDFLSSPWFDAMKEIKVDGVPGLVVTEWETGNISSSHRSLNRITLGLMAGIINGGIIVLPNRELYHYLTDRIGNYQELEPYFVIWEALAHEVENGIMEVIAVEHDGTSEDVPPIGKLQDGMADRDVSEV